MRPRTERAIRVNLVELALRCLCIGGVSPTDLVAVDRDCELDPALATLIDKQAERVGRGLDGELGRGAVRVQDRSQPRRIAVEACRRDEQIPRRPLPPTHPVQQCDLDLMRPGGQRLRDHDLRELPGTSASGRRVGAGHRHPIDIDGELGVAIESVFSDVEGQRIRLLAHDCTAIGYFVTTKYRPPAAVEAVWQHPATLLL